MIIHDIRQGSKEWHELRASHFTASEASAMLGVSKYTSRQELLRQKATGASEEVSPSQQALFDKGHAAEAAARPIAERIVGEDLFPATVSNEFDGLPLLASCDGMTMLGDTLFEHKLFNNDVAAGILEGVQLHDHYAVQMEQQLMVTGAEKCLFMCSDGTEDRCAWVWYESNPELRQRIIAGWKQFSEDLANYQHVESKPEPVGVSPESLPALHIELTGMVTASNLTEFRETAKAVIDAVNTDLKTDQDFANAEKAVKWCGDVEGKLEAAKQHALSQTASIDELFRAIDEVKEHTRQTRLKLAQLVKSRKDDLRAEIIIGGRDALVAHIDGLNERIGIPAITGCSVDFASAIKGMRSFDNMRDAVATALANAKIAANEQADNIERNLRTIAEQTDYQHLFHDKAQLVHKANDDLVAIIKSRIAEHKEAEREKEERIKRQAEEEARQKIEHEQNLERIRKEAEERAIRRDQEQAEADAKVVTEAEQRGAQQAEANHFRGVTKKEDIVHALRIEAMNAQSQVHAALMLKAADEIERLRAVAEEAA